MLIFDYPRLRTSVLRTSSGQSLDSPLDNPLNRPLDSLAVKGLNAMPEKNRLFKRKLSDSETRLKAGTLKSLKQNLKAAFTCYFSFRAFQTC